MPIEFPDDVMIRIRQRLKSYVLDEFDRDIGDLKAERMFEFMLGLVGASAYNRGVADAQAWLGGKLVDLPGDLHADVDWDG